MNEQNNYFLFTIVENIYKVILPIDTYALKRTTQTDPCFTKRNHP